MSQSDFSAQPRANEPVVGRDGLVTRAWRDYFARLAMAQSSDDLRQLYEALAARVAELAEGHSLRIIGRNSVSTAGTSVVEIQLVGDEAAPGNTEYYGTGPTGHPGFFPIASAIAVDTGELEKSVGPDGIITLGLAELPNAGGGTLQKTLRDGYGRVAGTSEATTDDLAEGEANLYFTDERADTRAAMAVDAHVAQANPHAQYLRGRIDQPVGFFQDPDLSDGIISICANGLSNPTPAIEAWADNGSTQANISSTTFGANGGGIFHGRMARGTKASPSGVLKGDIYCGFGGRPFAAGYGFLQSSPVSLHWVAAENQTSTGYGGYFRILTTKIGTTSRAESAVITDNGVIWAHDQQVVYDPTSYAQTSFLTGYTGMLVSSHNQQARHVIVSYGGLPSVNICGAGGTPSAPAPLGSTANMGALAFTTYAGSWVAPGIVIARTTEAHSATAQGTELVFGTTANGSASRVERWKFAASGDLLPVADNAYDVGGSAARPKQLWAMSGAINTSDAREKTSVRPLTASELAAAAELGGEIGVYQWLAMVADKGEGARQHIGLTVQRAIAILESHGLDPFAYGFICYDEWDELPEVIGEDGEVAQEHRPPGDRYSFRMDELLAFIARGMAHRLDAIEQRLAAAGL